MSKEIEYKDLIAFCDKDCKTTITYSNAYNLVSNFKKEFINSFSVV